MSDIASKIIEIELRELYIYSLLQPTLFRLFFFFFKFNQMEIDNIDPFDDERRWLTRRASNEEIQEFKKRKRRSHECAEAMTAAVSAA